jgi:hypothetical protein
LRGARRDFYEAARLRLALERYRAALLRGEEPEVTDEVFAACALEGVGIGHDILFKDEVKK